MSAREEAPTVGEIIERYDAALAAERQLADRLAEALRVLHGNVDDYQRINSLGGHDNHDMVLAREALAAHAERRKA